MLIPRSVKKRPNNTKYDLIQDQRPVNKKPRLGLGLENKPNLSDLKTEPVQTKTTEDPKTINTLSTIEVSKHNDQTSCESTKAINDQKNNMDMDGLTDIIETEPNDDLNVPIDEEEKEEKEEEEKEEKEEEEPIKAFSSDQRRVILGSDEPLCIICGRYGEYINDDTDNDVCSLECKAVDTNINYRIKPQKRTTTWILNDINAKISPFYVAENLHAKMTNYEEPEDVANMQKWQREAILKANEIDVKGDRVPHPICSFDQCKILGPTLIHNLDQIGWSMATSIQRQAVPAGLAGRDVYAVAPTSSGKTGAFVIPIIVHCRSMSILHNYKRRAGPYALILAPTRELCQQIETVTKILSKGIPNTRTALLIGGSPVADNIHRLRKGVQIIIGTPGRVLELVKEHPNLFRPWRIQMLVLDEADAMFTLGFGPQVRQILGKLPDTTKRQTSFYSATVNDPKEMERLCRRLTLPIEIRISQPKEGSSQQPEASNNVRQTILWVENASKAKKLMSILNDPKYFAPPVLIFVDSRLGAEFLTRAIQKRNKQLRVVAMHADKTQAERSAIVTGVNQQEPAWDIIVSTDVLSRGIDLPFVRLVINYDMAPTLEDYVHRIGRAVIRGPLPRDTKQKRGWAITFINSEHGHLLETFAKMLATKAVTQVTPLPSQLKRYL
ncbi:P-loop containing nucleoside triphosphate hydrolase protein [Phycomyces nitens]|nr:P-loop containing nucleoside triphosphate hydrolase protein [Phycomyces nitens]